MKNRNSIIILIALIAMMTLMVNADKNKLIRHKPVVVRDGEEDYGLIGYWGNNLSKNQFTDTKDQEKDLFTFCSTTNYSTYHLSYMYLHFDNNGLPGVDFDYHCNYPTNKFSNLSPPNKGYSALNCKSIGNDIKKCQAIGKKILLSVSPMDFLSSSADAERSADNIWNVFLGGTSQYRAFGDAILDGIDFHIFNNDVGLYYTVLINKLNNYISSATKQYTIAASVRCANPDVTMGSPKSSYYTDSPFGAIPTLFSYIIIFMTSSSNICGWQINNEGFWKQIQVWSEDFNVVNPSLKVYVGIPPWYDPSFSGGAVGDYIAPGEFYNNSVIPKMKEFTQFGGIALNDVSFDYNNRPCNNYKLYSDLIYQQLKAPVSVSGKNTPTDDICDESGGNSASRNGKSQDLNNGSISSFGFSNIVFAISLPFIVFQLFF